MAATNGHVEDQQRPVTPMAQLGKRKRGSSPSTPRSGSKRSFNAVLRQNIDEVVSELRSHEFASALLRQPSQQHSSSPQPKRRRTEDRKQTIETAVASRLYRSLDDFLSDLLYAAKLVQENFTEETGIESRESQSINSAVHKIVSQYTDTPGEHLDEEPEEDSATERKPIEVLSLRGSLEGGGVKQLFTGLRKFPSGADKPTDIDAKSLPNGFEVVEAATLSSILQPNGESRTFGDVFASRRNVKQLEIPRSSRGARNNALTFAEPPDEALPANKQDYKHSSLNSGYWVTYANTSADSRRKLQSNSKDIDIKSQALFKASFSSFAPTQDNTYSVVSQTDRARLWWKKYGSQKKIYPSLVDDANHESETNTLPDISEDIVEFIENYEEETPGIKLNADEEHLELDEGEKLLSEISELLQTLSSYQYIRDSDQTRNTGTTTKPTGGEFDTYELLKSQLKLLIESLPPFAVSKLDGNQLKALNISTNIVVKTPDYAGTGQADEYSLRKHRASHTPSNAFGRSTNNPQAPTRTYGAGSGYNNPVRPFTASVAGSVNAGSYSQRAAAPAYTTPRPSVTNSTPYSQTPYNRPPGYQPATIQEYQRSLQNGYNPNIGGQQTTFTQRTPQTSHQTQQSQYATRTDSPKKPLTNGQTPAYSARPYTPQNYPQGSKPATIQQHQAMQQAKAYQEAQRQASGTPQPGVEVNGRTATPGSDAQGQ